MGLVPERRPPASASCGRCQGHRRRRGGGSARPLRGRGPRSIEGTSARRALQEFVHYVLPGAPRCRREGGPSGGLLHILDWAFCLCAVWAEVAARHAGCFRSRLEDVHGFQFSAINVPLSPSLTLQIYNLTNEFWQDRETEGLLT